MDKDHKDPQELDLTEPRLASYKLKWKRHQDTVYWVGIQPVNRTLFTRHIFSCFTAHISMSHTTLAQDVCPHHVIHASCAVVNFALFTVTLIFLFHSPDLHLHLHLPCGLVRGEVHSALPRMRS